jgi:hypothetical protein
MSIANDSDNMNGELPGLCNQSLILIEFTFSIALLSASEANTTSIPRQKLQLLQNLLHDPHKVETSKEEENDYEGNKICITLTNLIIETNFE